MTYPEVADISTSLESVWKAFTRVKYEKTSENLLVFQKRGPDNILIVNFEDFISRAVKTFSGLRSRFLQTQEAQIFGRKYGKDLKAT